MAKQKKTGKQKNQESQARRNAAQNKGQQEQAPKEEPRDVVTLEFDDGREQECFVEGVFDVGDRDYIALVPDDRSGDVYIYKYIEGEGDDYRLEEETDAAKFAAAVREYEEIVGHEPERKSHE